MTNWWIHVHLSSWQYRSLVVLPGTINLSFQTCFYICRNLYGLVHIPDWPICISIQSIIRRYLRRFSGLPINSSTATKGISCLAFDLATRTYSLCVNDYTLANEWLVDITCPRAVFSPWAVLSLWMRHMQASTLLLASVSTFPIPSTLRAQTTVVSLNLSSVPLTNISWTSPVSMLQKHRHLWHKKLKAFQ